MDVKLPKLGEGAESGVVVSIAVKEGDQVTKGQTILELENEKAVAAIPSSAAGKVTRVNVKTGDRISVGHTVITLDGAGVGAAAEEKSEQPKKATAPSAKSQRRAAPEPDEEEDFEDEPLEETAADKAGFAPPASPSIRKLARDIGLDLRKIQGSEDGGRIVLTDIRAYIQKLQRIAARPRGGAAAAPAEVKPPERIDFSQWGSVTKKPLSPIRLTISRRMVENAVS